MQIVCYAGEEKTGVVTQDSIPDALYQMRILYLSERSGLSVKGYKLRHCFAVPESEDDIRKAVKYSPSGILLIQTQDMRKLIITNNDGYYHIRRFVKFKKKELLSMQEVYERLLSGYEQPKKRFWRIRK